MSYTNKSFQNAKKLFDKYNLVYLTWSKYENDWNNHIHFHSFTEIMFVVSGQGKIQTDSQAFHIKEGDLIIINPYTQHTEFSDVEQSLEYYVFAIENIVFDYKSSSLAQSDESLNSSSNNDLFIKNISSSDDRKLLCALFNRVLTELDSQKLYHEVYAQSLINEALVIIIRTTNLKDIERPSHTLTAECAFVKRYIDLHFNQNVTLDELAQKTFFSKYYLIHSFKKQLGVSPIQYLMAKRLDEGKILLKTTQKSITNICLDIGFSSAPYFSKIFKQNFNMSPIEYRQSMRGNNEKTNNC